MIIENTYYKLVIRLQTNLSTIPVMTYKHIEEQYITDVENSQYTVETASSSRDGDIITYTIPFNQYEVGDELKDFVCTLSGTRNIYDLNEGVSIFVDGTESDVIKMENGSTVKNDNDEYVRIKPLNSSQFALVFKDTDVHTVQAVYSGNNSIGVALSNKAIVTPQIREEHEEHPEIEGTYKIEFVKYQEQMLYVGDVDWLIRLTKGNVGVANAVIQLDTPTTSWTYVTDSNGYVSFKINKSGVERGYPTTISSYRSLWKVGDYVIIARYHYYDETTDSFEEVICHDTRKLHINKSTPTMEVVNYAQTRNGRAVFKVKDPMGFPLQNTKIVAVVNGRTYTKTTDSNGNISFTLGVKGNIKYSFKFIGNENYNSKEWIFSETIN